MPRPKMENLFPEYIRVKKPDQKRLAELTVKAMGDRSLSKFAADCDVYASTLSRLIKSQTKGTCSEKLIKSIYENASRDMGINRDTFKDMLLDAYGLAPRKKLGGENEIYYDDMPPAQNLVNRRLKDLTKSFDTTAREIIISQLVGMGYTVKERPIEEASEKKYFNFALSTDATKEAGIEEWYFEPMYGYRFPSYEYFNNLYAYLYTNDFSEQKKGCSIIVSHQTSFDDVLKMVEQKVVHDYISILLVDTDSHRVSNEFILQQGRKEHTRIFCPQNMEPVMQR